MRIRQSVFLILLILNPYIFSQTEPGKCEELKRMILEQENQTSSQDKSLDITPEFAGEIDSLFKIISHPPLPEKVDSLREGKVFISFIVDTSGTIGCCEVEEGITPEYNLAALHYFENLHLKFTPGKKYIKGKYILAPFRMVLPLIYGSK